MRISRRQPRGANAARQRNLSTRRGRVRVPWRVVSSPAYPDVALSVYVKAAALAWRPEGCTAGVSVLARYLQMSASAVERGLRALTHPDPVDGVVELHSRRRTKPGGQGTTAERRVRGLTRQEPFVWVPVVAAELLEPRQLRAWAALAYAGMRGIRASQTQLGEVLVHHSGKRAGLAISAEAASAVVDSLEALGWLKVGRRQGLQGRHIYEVLEEPAVYGLDASTGLESASVEEAGACTGVSDGSGSRVGEGSLATEEDLQIDRLGFEGRGVSPAVGEAKVVGPGVAASDSASRVVCAAQQHGLALSAVSNSSRPICSSTAQRTYMGPELTFNPRLAWIVEPLRTLLSRASTYVQREFARQLGAQLEMGVDPRRLRTRLESRFAQTSPADIRSVEGWLLKVATVRWGCRDPQCEEGVRWNSGDECIECRSARMEQRALRDRLMKIDAGQCPDCLCWLGESGRCPTCRPVLPTAVQGVSLPPVRPSMAPHVVGTQSQPLRCPDCGSWAPGRGADGRCGKCGVRYVLRQSEQVVMDAASAGVSGPQKLHAAVRACAEVRRHVQVARQQAVAAGLDQTLQDASALEAAKEVVLRWMSPCERSGTMKPPRS